MSEENNKVQEEQKPTEQAEEQAVTQNTPPTAEEPKVPAETLNIESEDKNIEIDAKKWLYAFYAKIDGENKKFYILKPGRRLRQSGELEYAKQLAKFVKAGLLPKAAWGTILDNAGGTISDTEAESYSSSKNRFFELSLQLNTLQQQEKNEENLKKIEDIMFDIEIVKNQIQAFELEQIYIFENTAEAKARNSTIEWWLCNLSYGENQEPFFKGQSVEEKLDWYDSLDPSNEKDSNILKIGQRFSYLITLWFLNRISTFEQFKDADIANTKR